MKTIQATLALLMALALPGYASEIIFSPTTWSGPVGSTFTLTINGRDFQENVDGGGVNIVFDPAIVQANSVSIDQEVWDFYVDTGSIDNSSGTIIGLVFNAFSAVGPGNFVVATVVFTIVGTGCSNLELAEYPLNPFASAGQLINPSFTPGNISTGVIAGDLNGDCRVNVADILILMRIITNQVTPSQQQQAAADVAPLFNNVPAPDGEINLGDLVAIQRKVLGLVNFDFIN